MSILRSSKVITKTGTISTAAQTLVQFGFSADDVSGADRVIFSTSSGGLRLNWDTTPITPSTSTGYQVPASVWPRFVLEGRFNAANLQMIRDGSTDAVTAITIETD